MKLNTFLILLMGVIFLAGCISVQKAPYDAIAVWQHKATDFDIWYSIWDDENLKWYTPQGGNTAPIAVLIGDDQDPDVSSKEDRAVAVWAHNNNGNYDIWFSRWNPEKWTNPATLVNLSGNDLDPTVAVGASSTIVVWVNGNNLYFSELKNNIWSKPTLLFDDIQFEKVSLPELSWSPWGAFGLIFTGDLGEGAKAYGAYYFNGIWRYPKEVPNQQTEAVIDNNIPTDERTGVDSAPKGKGQAVWPTVNKEVWSSVWGDTMEDAKKINTEKMPDVAFDNSSIAHILNTKEDKIIEENQIIGDTGDSDFRTSVTFIKNKKIGLAVWWSAQNSGEIFYSRKGTQGWSIQKMVNGQELVGLDRNPAVTPLRLFVEEKGEEIIHPYCGDGILQAPEQCEVLIGCPNNQWCDMKDCTCKNWPWDICGDGILQSPPEECEKGIACKNPNQTCNKNTCKCIGDQTPPPQPPETERPCVVPQVDVERPLVVMSPFDPSKEVCVDKCPENYVCDMRQCTCKKREGEASCYKRTVTTKAPGYEVELWEICKDDCDKLGEGYICELEECVCVKDTRQTVKCSEGNDFFSSDTMICKDDCEENMVCDTSECVCVTREQDYKCQKNTNALEETGINTFRSGIDICKNDCDEGYECTAECICQPFEKMKIACAPTAIGYNPDTHICVTDTCPEGFECNEEYCMCIMAPRTVTCGSEQDFRPGVDTCESVDVPQGQECDMQTCRFVCSDVDQDGVCDTIDNCPELSNSTQQDEDSDGLGDHCDPQPFVCESHFSGMPGQLVGSGSDPQIACGVTEGYSSDAQSCEWTCNFYHFEGVQYKSNNQVVNLYGCCWMASSSGPCEPTDNGCVCPTEQEMQYEICPSLNPF